MSLLRAGNDFHTTDQATEKAFHPDKLFMNEWLEVQPF